jgi:hypothetical protein
MINFEVVFDFEEYSILKDYETLQILCEVFYDMYVMRLSTGKVSPCHLSCIAGHKLGV